jgi:uncharacterized protein (TIGR03437 family)
VNLNATGLAPGTYTATLTFNSANGFVETPVSLTVTSPPALVAQPGTLSVAGTAGSASVTSTPVQLTSTNANVAFTVTSNAPWLTVAASGMSTPATLTITANPVNLIGGTYQGSITVTAAGATNSPLMIPVTYQLAGGSNAGVANGASFQPGLAAPNTILSLFDALGCGAGAQMTVNGLPAQVLFANANQINFVTPNNIGTSGTATIQATCNGNSSGSIMVPLGPVDPGVFTEGGAGTGQGSIVNSNGTVNTAANPISRGDYISVYVTGFGPYNPVGADGLTRLQFPVTVTIGGVSAGVSYAGAAPTETSGLQQINVFVPTGVQTGPSVPIVLTVNQVNTQGGITVAIQ